MPQHSNSLPPRPANRGRPSRGTLYARVDTAVAELRDRFGGLPSPVEAREIWTDIWVEEAHHSTALEGNTLVLRQVEELLREGRAVGSKPLAEYLEVTGYADAARWVYAQAIDPGDEPPRQLLTLTELRHIHRLAMSPAWAVAPHPDANQNEGPDNFREHDIRPFPGGMTPPSHALVPARLRDWLDEVQGISTLGQEPMMEHLARAHVHFEQVHPFLDGNGRTGRLALNLVLTRLDHPPAIILKRDRQRYVKALRRADAGNAGPLGEMLARGVLDNLYRFVLPAVAGPMRLVPLTALASPEISVVALRNAAQRGRLRAQRGTDGQWRSSRAWVQEYLASRSRRGRRATHP